MSIPNKNPNNNLKCDDGSSFQGFIIDNGSMSIVKGASTVLDVSLKGVFMPVDQFVFSDILVKANSSVFIDGDSIQDAYSDVQFISLVVTYPAADTNKIIIPTIEKYINFQYPQFGSGTYNIGKIMILSGTTKPGSGWGLNESPGGITLINPHTAFDVRVKLLAFN